jgi:hypothetical protein
MMAKSQLDLFTVLIVVGVLLGIIISILNVLGIWNPIGGFVGPTWSTATVEMLLCAMVLMAFVLTRNMNDTRLLFIILIATGIILIVLFGNLAGILWIIPGIMLPFD